MITIKTNVVFNIKGQGTVYLANQSDNPGIKLRELLGTTVELLDCRIAVGPYLVIGILSGDGLVKKVVQDCVGLVVRYLGDK